MQSKNRLLDDFARVMSGATGVAGGFKEELEAHVRQRIERVLSQMDLVTREEFEVVSAMAARARSEQDALFDRIEALESEIATLKTAKPKTTRKTTTAKKDTAASKD